MKFIVIAPWQPRTALNLATPNAERVLGIHGKVLPSPLPSPDDGWQRDDWRAGFAHNSPSVCVCVCVSENQRCGRKRSNIMLNAKVPPYYGPGNANKRNKHSIRRRATSGMFVFDLNHKGKLISCAESCVCMCMLVQLAGAPTR